jgi:glycosyltransferase involved in cell wall biosynthesis
MGAGIVLSQALQRLGVDSRVLATKSHPFGFKEDFLFPQKPRFLKGPFAKRFMRSAWRKFYDFDILHNHDNYRLPSYVFDHWKGAFVQHYHDPKTTSPLYPDIPSFASLPSIIRVVPSAIWVPLPVDTTFFRPATFARGTVSIGYNYQSLDPTKLSYIPKKEIDLAVEKLRGKAVSCPLTGVIEHKDIREYYRRIDVWVDRIGCDFYGFAAVEVASMGIPVITQIGEDEQKFVPDCPFVNTERDGVVEAIKLLVEDETARRELGKKARDFAVRKHDAIRAAKICLSKYEELERN